jgi:hypothetical protein
MAVRRLAVFDRPSEVRDALKKKYGVEPTLDQLAHYDPTNKSGRDLAGDLTELFHETRRAFVEEQKGIAIAYKAKRLRDLEKVKEKLMRKIDDLESMDHHLGVVEVLAEIRDTLKQAAKESGEQYTNKQQLEHTGQGGGPVRIQRVNEPPDPDE